MNNEKHSQKAIVELVQQAKHRPLPRSTKALTVIVILAVVFTGGLAYGKHRATASTNSGLSLAALGGGVGGFGGGGFGGRFRNGGGAAGGSGAVGGDLGGAGAPSGSTPAPSDVAGTVISITGTAVVIQTLAGDKQTFPLGANTHVRISTPATLAGVKAGDIVTIRADAANKARTITVVK